MWLCEGKLKVKTAHFRLPSASQKRACLSFLLVVALKSLSLPHRTINRYVSKNKLTTIWRKRLCRTTEKELINEKLNITYHATTL